MSVWEYKVLSFMDWASRERVEHRLTDLGNRGWQLVGTIDAGRYHFMDEEPTDAHEFYLILQRKKRDSSNVVPLRGPAVEDDKRTG